MKIYLISQGKNKGYDTYDSAIVAAKSEEAARNMHPNGARWNGSTWAENGIATGEHDWAKPKDVEVELVGTAKKGTKEGVILASFNAG